MRLSTDISESVCEVCLRSFDETEEQHEGVCRDCDEQIVDAALRALEEVATCSD